MKSGPYHEVPVKSVWVKDSYINDIRVRRKTDKVLHRIDKLVEDISGTMDRSELTYLYCELFFATNYWLNNYLATETMKNSRQPAIAALRSFVEGELAGYFHCDEHAVEQRMRSHFTTFMSSLWCVDRPVGRLHQGRLNPSRGKAGEIQAGF